MASLGAETLQKAKSEDKPIFLSIPEVQSALISSAMKNVDVAVYNYLKYCGLPMNGGADSQCQKAIIEGSGHVPNYEQPQAFLQLLLDFLPDADSQITSIDGTRMSQFR